MNIDNLKRTLDSDSGEDLKEFLVEEVLSLKDIDNIKTSRNPIKATIELKATKLAYDKLTNIFNKIINMSGAVKGIDPRDKYD